MNDGEWAAAKCVRSTLAQLKQARFTAERREERGEGRRHNVECKQQSVPCAAA